MSISLEQMRLNCFHAVNHPDKHMPQLLSEAEKLEKYIYGRGETKTEPTSFVERVRIEAAELWAKIESLQAFTLGDIFKTLSADDQHDLDNQLFYMKKYNESLVSRLKRYDSHS